MILMLLFAASATQSPIVLKAGQQTTMTVGGDKISASAPTAAPLTAHDIEAGQILGAEGCTEQNCGPSSRPITARETKTAQMPIASGTIRATFGLVGGESVLVFQNASDRLLTYRARITAGGQTQTTDVCQVLPLKAGYEHWPYPIDKIELSGFELGSWDGATPPTCE